MVLDAAAVRNLEILRDASGDRRASLAGVLDATVTAMGSRLLRDWLVRPLANTVAAAARHDAVAALVEEPARLAVVRELAGQVGDLERMASRLGLSQARPGELAALRAALAVLPDIRAELAASPSQLLAALGGATDPLEDLREDLAVTLAEEPPALFGPGTVRSGADPDLDESRSLAHGAKEVLGELEARERARSGIGNLRIRYNRVFGYAFEVSSNNRDRVPPDWVRRQTLAGAERFVTAELEGLERRITSAEARAGERERELFAALLERCAARAGRLAATARALAAVDVLASFAERARHADYRRPRLVEGPRMRLVGSRHPVVGSGRPLRVRPQRRGARRRAPADRAADRTEHGRQVHLPAPGRAGGGHGASGSFVAAEEAEIGEIDRVFTRVGAADDLARGESTFMVEMTEVAGILRHATAQLPGDPRRGRTRDRDVRRAVAGVGRGRGAARGAGDGRGPLVLFATHYHELTDLADRLGRVVNASVAVKEWQGNVLFLHRVVAGPSDRSYGIHVAKLAGVPEAVCRRAREVLRQLERQELKVLEAAAPGPGTSSSSCSRRRRARCSAGCGAPRSTS